MTATPHTHHFDNDTTQTGVFTGSEAVELAVVERAGFIESRHLGSGVVLDPQGEILRSLGAPEKPVFARSTLKPFQALAVLGAGVEMNDVCLAVATASHNGTPDHVSVVHEILQNAGIGEEALQCPPALPADANSRNEVLRSGGSARPIYMECSGKHAAMLQACTHNGWPLDSYLDPEHPLQERIRDTVERLSGEKITTTGIDGCGTPVYALSLIALARGIQRITTASPTSPFGLFRNAAQLTNAVLHHGWALAGPGSADTITISELGIFSKRGAEGVLVLTAPCGTTVALKVLDGNSRAASLVGLTLLVRAGALSAQSLEQVLPQLDLTITGAGRQVGQIRTTL